MPDATPRVRQTWAHDMERERELLPTRHRPPTPSAERDDDRTKENDSSDDEEVEEKKRSMHSQQFAVCNSWRIVAEGSVILRGFKHERLSFN